MSAPSIPSLLSEFGLDDDQDDVASGDLGLGMGLKPGALPATLFDFEQDEPLSDDQMVLPHQIPSISDYSSKNMLAQLNYPCQYDDQQYKEKAAGTHDYILIDHQVDVPTHLQNCSQNKPIEKLSVAKRFNINHLDTDHSHQKDRKRLLLGRYKRSYIDGRFHHHALHNIRNDPSI